jgi:hypothetical protein
MLQERFRSGDSPLAEPVGAVQRDACERDLKGAGQMRKLHEMDEGSGDIVVDPIETDTGSLSNDIDTDANQD